MYLLLNRREKYLIVLKHIFIYYLNIIVPFLKSNSKCNYKRLYFLAVLKAVFYTPSIFKIGCRWNIKTVMYYFFQRCSILVKNMNFEIVAQKSKQLFTSVSKLQRNVFIYISTLKRRIKGSKGKQSEVYAKQQFILENNNCINI